MIKFAEVCWRFAEPNKTKEREARKEERLNEKLHFVAHNEGKHKDLAVCSNRKIQGGRKEMYYFCETCSWKPGLHHPGSCFKRYHTMEKYKIILVMSLSKVNQQYI